MIQFIYWPNEVWFLFWFIPFMKWEVILYDAFLIQWSEFNDFNDFDDCGVISLFVKIWTCWRFFSLNVWKETSTQYYLWAELLSLIDLLWSLIDLLWSLTDLLWSLMITYVGWFPNKKFRYRDFVAFIFCNDHEGSSMIMLANTHSLLSGPSIHTLKMNHRQRSQHVLSCTISSLSVAGRRRWWAECRAAVVNIQRAPVRPNTLKDVGNASPPWSNRPTQSVTQRHVAWYSII